MTRRQWERRLKSEFAFFQSLSQSKVPIFSIDAIATLHPSVPVPAPVLEHFVTSYAWFALWTFSLSMTNITYRHMVPIMGTRMAPSYANLFLAEFETDTLSRAPFQTFIRWRYIRHLLACEQALQFGQAKRVSRERASERRSSRGARSREARDIFMIWTRSVQDLNTFTSFLNEIHPTIKFTRDYSFTSRYQTSYSFQSSSLRRICSTGV